MRDLNLAIDSKLRGCDLVALRVNDVAPNSHSIDRANVRQNKTGRPVRFELTEGTRQAVSIMQGDEEPLVAAALFLLQLFEELPSVACVTVVVIFIRKHLARSTKAWS